VVSGTDAHVFVTVRIWFHLLVVSKDPRREDDAISNPLEITVIIYSTLT
jgi:hypothetical protein